MPEIVPVFADPTPMIRIVETERPWTWLAAGWRDLRAAPMVGLTYGAMFALAGMALVFALWQVDRWYLALPLISGFLLWGPSAAVGLYEVSRALGAGEPATLGRAFGAWRANSGQIGLFTALLTLLLLAWMRVAQLLFALYFTSTTPDIENFLDATFLTPEGLPFLLLGTAVGSVFAMVVFGISAVAIPMLLDRPTNVFTAIATSFQAVDRNRPAMGLWAGLIVLLIGFGVVTGFAGLVLTLPLIGHATWHAYRDLVIFAG